MTPLFLISPFFFFNDTATTEIYTLSLHDALPIYRPAYLVLRSAIRYSSTGVIRSRPNLEASTVRSEEHTSELQSQSNLVCRLLLEKKKKKAQHLRGLILHPTHVIIRIILTRDHTR